ncbi:hypothetical protein [Paraburkholderia oxyphila]|uniref:hypothetical protein n=1 Tax=Paraburkholderia oxyphila TaxID=614212 RepID=UPI0012ED8273|nr:hypothetical protein [Paraburkholderia oxyphila]
MAEQINDVIVVRYETTPGLAAAEAQAEGDKPADVIIVQVRMGNPSSIPFTPVRGRARG